MVERQFLKLSVEEKDFLDRIVTLSGIDKNIVKEILQTILKMTTIELYAGFNTITIPYLCSLSISSHEKLNPNGVETIVEIESIPSQNLIEEIKSINEGEITSTQNYTRQKMFAKINEVVE